MTSEIPDYDWRYAQQEWERGRDLYVSLLVRAGFDEVSGLVLDAGTGVGQWVDALSSMGVGAIGVDVRLSRLRMASQLLRGKGHLVCASIEELPFKKSVFSGILSYGVLMFTDVKTALREFSRVSKVGAKMYLCWNAIGWSIHLLLSRKYGWQVKLQALQTLFNTWLGFRGTTYISKNRMRRLLVAIDHSMHPLECQIFPPKYLGLDCVLEAMA